MQALRLCARTARTARAARSTPRTTIRALSAASSSSARPVPWFVDPTPSPSRTHQPPPHLPSPSAPAPTLPASLPPAHPLAALHTQLLTSPHLEPGFPLVRAPVPTEAGPALPDAPARGRRKRGRTYAGEGVGDDVTGPWRWICVAQVKDGAEGRGAIESVARVVRKTLLTATPPLPLAQKRKREVSDGWLMIDAGEFAVHIVSRAARERFFPERRFFSVSV